MPAHAVAGLLALLLSVLAALAALVYAAAPPTRRVLRWPLVALVVLAFAAVIVAGEAGATLLSSVEDVGQPAEVTAARAHGHGSDALTTAVFFLLVAALATVWGPLRPASDGRRVWAVVVAAIAVTTLVCAGVVLGAALEAVTAGNPAWQAG
ncbi:hypothetical protein [Cellulomonas sp. ICMP 17802]|uniref:hypothetical protein n=1 Tax=Cellulomonas sp. ICMP 17802 TaxID=3239199 RepID=UPI00351AF974